MENIGSITYRAQLNQLYLRSKKVIRFFERFDPQKVGQFVQLVLSGITPAKELEDIHLEAFLATNARLRKFREHFPQGIGLVVYPRKGQIKEFILNPKTEFFSDIHQDPDPLTVKQLGYGLHIHERKTEDYIWVNYNNQSVPNRITGGLFFKKNPFKNPSRYAGFANFSRLDPFELMG